MPWVGLQCVIVVLPGHTHVFFVWMDTGLDSNNTHRYVDVTKLSVSHSNMIKFTSGTCFYWI